MICEPLKDEYYLEYTSLFILFHGGITRSPSQLWGLRVLHSTGPRLLLAFNSSEAFIFSGTGFQIQICNVFDTLVKDMIKTIIFKTLVLHIVSLCLNIMVPSQVLYPEDYQDDS